MPWLLAVRLPEALAVAPVEGLGPVNFTGAGAAAAAEAGRCWGGCLSRASWLLLLLAPLIGFLMAASTLRTPAVRAHWSDWRALGWLYWTIALPSTFTWSLCLPSSLNTIKRDTAPAAVGRHVIGNSTLLCGATALLQLRLAAAGRLGSADKLNPS